ncbi:phospho-sugar mutase [Filobacillus milosensis]|uniref:Phosphoglucomutase n=1 Tax=Filobacillus milosensis TaxID=94137 RepID=A0A4Y8IDZ4_9BACI|nr:phospho-sugar mutase [Filobacillus milosensis]TFB14212.1 phospho-sugar mutase [Filobacillus milosensis]
MDWKSHYQRWKDFVELDGQVSKQLIAMRENDLTEAFHGYLTFGTGGMRGILGPGTNRMNIYTVRKAAKGLALYLESQGEGFKYRGVAVAYDSRYMSKEFAVETARVLGVHGIPTYIFSSLRPTPELSFAVRHLGTAAGVMITASHNPPEYNGYKVYNEVGGQLPPVQADQVIQQVNSVEDELTINVMDQRDLEDRELLKWIDTKVDEAYLENLEDVVVDRKVIEEQTNDFTIVFTPLHGTANQLVKAGLSRAGFHHIHIVQEQAEADPEFPTVASPNPEEHQAFELAIEQGEKIEADILVGTDPDADRLGVAAINAEGKYQVLSGNQLGALMLDYLLSHQENLPENAVMLKTIVTSELGKAVAEHYDVETMNVLTGFKFIGEKIEEFHQNGSHEFIFGYEESYGYLIKDFARDKDAVQATVLAAEMAAYFKASGKTLFDALEDLYEHHGYYLEDLHSMKLEGLEGAKQIDEIMESFRQQPLQAVRDLSVLAVEDYKNGTRTELDSEKQVSIHLPKANVVKYILSEDCWCCLRPSGTEPKIKFYFGVKGATRQEAEARLEQLKNAVLERVTVLKK